MMAVGTTVTVLSIVGLVLGLVVLVVVISLLNGVLSPLRRILADLRSAKTAPMLERGVPGTDQLGATRRLAESVPDLALRYLQKLSSQPAPAPAPAPAPPPAPASAAPASAAPATAAPAATATTTGLPSALDDPRLPAWKRYRG
jgi:hypothetical protein